MIKVSPAILGLLRGIGTVALFSALSYIGNATNLTGVFTPEVAGLISGIVLLIEHQLESTSTTGSALFGAVRTH